MLGQVIEIKDDGNLVVQLNQTEADSGKCSSCSLEKSCTLPGAKILEIPPGPKLPAMKIHDLIDVEMSSAKLLWLSASLYLLPLVLMVSGAAVLHSLFESQGENASILGALAGLATGLLFNIILSRKMSRKSAFDIRRIS